MKFQILDHIHCRYLSLCSIYPVIIIIAILSLFFSFVGEG